MKAIAEHIETELARRSVRPSSVEGLRFSHWVLMDYGNVVVHVFEEGTREYYELEKFWLDAPRLSVEDNGARNPHDTAEPAKKERGR